MGVRSSFLRRVPLAADSASKELHDTAPSSAVCSRHILPLFLLSKAASNSTPILFQ